MIRMNLENTSLRDWIPLGSDLESVAKELAVCSACACSS